jgi:hypothetical protein
MLTYADVCSHQAGYDKSGWLERLGMIQIMDADVEECPKTADGSADMTNCGGGYTGKREYRFEPLICTLERAGSCAQYSEEDLLSGYGYEMITALYWSFTTMTTIGYGDITAMTAGEKGLACIVMLVGCAFFAWSTASITSLLVEKPFSVARFQETMDELDEFVTVEYIAKSQKISFIMFPSG